MSTSSSKVRPIALHRIPSLDGLRAVSILMVIGLHTLQQLSLHHPAALPWMVLFNGSLGVRIFFVISGYLITGLLLKEHRARGAISLRGFFLKRAFRILPPILVYVGVIALLALAGRILLTGYDTMSALFFFRDYSPAAPAWALDQFWSLSIEEQFYILWPPLLALCLRRGTGAGSLLAGKIAVAVLVVAPVLRGLTLFSHNPYVHNPYGFHMHVDMLMFGCVAALLEKHTAFERLYRAATRFAWLAPAVLLISSAMEMRFQNLWNGTIGTTVTGLAITALLLWCVRNASSAAGRFLNAAPVVRIGVLSYSMYIWQTLFLHERNGAVFSPASWIGRPPAAWLAILLVAELSFLIVEQPSLRLRNRLLRRISRPTVNPALGSSPLAHFASVKAVD